MEGQTKALVGGLSVAGFVLVSFACLLALNWSQPPQGLAVPTPLCVAEVKALALIFLAGVTVLEPARQAIRTRGGGLHTVAEARAQLPPPAKVAALAAFAFATFVFAFWSVADVLGGYNGYGYSFAEHPVLADIYDALISKIPYVSAWDKGSQASFFFTIACLALVALRIDRGLWAALKDTVTLFAAPALVLFEFGVWHFAPNDMTWHVTDYLWIGGTNDKGYRANDLVDSYVFSNWLVLFVSVLLVASRLPLLSKPSKVLWGGDNSF